MLDDLAALAAYPLRGAVAVGAAAYGLASLPFQRVDSVHACPATGVGLTLQRRACHAKSPPERLHWSERASRAREMEDAGRLTGR